jgi:hypothetical protein
VGLCVELAGAHNFWKVWFWYRSTDLTYIFMHVKFEVS